MAAPQSGAVILNYISPENSHLAIFSIVKKRRLFFNNYPFSLNFYFFPLIFYFFLVKESIQIFTIVTKKIGGLFFGLFSHFVCYFALTKRIIFAIFK